MSIRVPPSLHEAFVDRHQARDPITRELLPDEELRTLSRAMASARLQAEQLSELATAMRADRTRTPEAAAVELRKAALTIGEKAARSLDGARERALRTLRQIEAETMVPPPPRDAVALQIEAEVRAKLDRLPEDKRRSVISTALTGGDDGIIGAVLRGPAMLSGLDQMEHEVLRLRWQQARHPEKAAKMERIGKALEDVERGGNLMMRFVEGLSTSQAAQAQADRTNAALQAAQAAE